jgi:hypothetical protein
LGNLSDYGQQPTNAIRPGEHPTSARQFARSNPSLAAENADQKRKRKMHSTGGSASGGGGGGPKPPGPQVGE